MRTLRPALLGLLLGCTASSVLLAQPAGAEGNDRARVPGNRDQAMRQRCNVLTGLDRERCYTELRDDERNRMGDRWPAAGIGSSSMQRGLIAGREPEGARLGGG